jgi:hypothetical protein
MFPTTSRDKTEDDVPVHLPSDVWEVLRRLANAVLPLDAMAANDPPRPVAFIPRIGSMPWRPSGKPPTLNSAVVASLENFDELFGHDAPNEVLSGRWLMLKANPLAYFRPAHGTAGDWRAVRSLNPVAKFGVCDGDSGNMPYLVTEQDGSKSPVSRKVFYAACWDPLLITVGGASPSGVCNLDTINWVDMANRMLGNQLPGTWPTASRVPSRDFVQRFTIDLLIGCLGQRNRMLDKQDPLWQRATLIEASENRHIGNRYSVKDVDDAVAALKKALPSSQAPTGGNP